MAFFSRFFSKKSPQVMRSAAAPVNATTGGRSSSSSSSSEDDGIVAPPTMTGCALSAPADLAGYGAMGRRPAGGTHSDRSTAVNSRRAGGEIRRSQTYAASSSYASALQTSCSTRPSISSCDGTSMDDRLRQNYGKLKQMHVGRMAVILEGVDRRNKQPVIIKAYSKAGMTASARDQVEREQAVLRTAAACPGVVRLLENLDDATHTYLVLESAPGYTLIELMAQSGGRLHEVRCVGEVVAPVLRALAALHALGIVHRDVKPEHIICSLGGGVKLVDFAQAAQQRHQCLNCRVGQLEYMAPEVLNKPTASDIFHQVLHQGMSEGELPQYDEKADVWSLGCVVYEALTGQQPFMAETATELAALHDSMLAQQGPDGVPLLLQHPCISEPARGFLASVLQVDPALRPPALELLQHPWVMHHTGGGGGGGGSRGSQSQWLFPTPTGTAHGSPREQSGSGLRPRQHTESFGHIAVAGSPPGHQHHQQQQQQQQQQQHRLSSSAAPLAEHHQHLDEQLQDPSASSNTTSSNTSRHSSLSAMVEVTAAAVARQLQHNKPSMAVLGLAPAAAPKVDVPVGVR